MGEVAPPVTLQYHQRSALLHNIIRYIQTANAASLLDIGAGTPGIALPLSRSVQSYRAVEQDPDRARELREAGLDVIHGTFPVPLDTTYDVVLSCHSVPELGIAAYRPFLEAAWASTNRTGMMLIVTFKGSRGAVDELHRELLGAPDGLSPEYSAVIDYCNSVGATEIRTVNSFVEAETAVEIADFIDTWLSGSRRVREGIRGRLMEILEARYRVRDGLYMFPTQHLFISCTRG